MLSDDVIILANLLNNLGDDNIPQEQKMENNNEWLMTNDG